MIDFICHQSTIVSIHLATQQKTYDHQLVRTDSRDQKLDAFFIKKSSAEPVPTAAPPKPAAAERCVI
jgi:hypothetical protein